MFGLGTQCHKCKAVTIFTGKDERGHLQYICPSCFDRSTEFSTEEIEKVDPLTERALHLLGKYEDVIMDDKSFEDKIDILDSDLAALSYALYKQAKADSLPGVKAFVRIISLMASEGRKEKTSDEGEAEPPVS